MTLYAGRPVEAAETWALTFAQLDALLAEGGGRTVVLLDEIS